MKLTGSKPTYQTNRKFGADNDIYVLLYDVYVDMLYAYGRGMGFEKEELRDAIHDVFLNFITRQTKFDNVHNLRYYLLRSLRNKLIDMKRTSLVSCQFDESSEPEMYLTVSIDETLADRERVAALKSRLENMLNELSSKQKQAVYMKYMLDMDYEDIAAVLDVTPHAVRKFVSKGLANLRRRKTGLIL